MAYDFESNSYHSDHRVRAGEQRVDLLTVEDDLGVEHVLPTTWSVCPTCSGEGAHVNPSIDAGGLTAEDFEDEDFAEDYRKGTYDVACYGCGGKRVVRALDERNCPPALLKLYKRQQRELAETYAMEAAERRMGA